MIEDLLGEPESREVVEWLQSGPPDTRTLGEIPTTAASLELAREIYSRGAKKVTAVKIDSYPGGEQNTGKLVITLLDDPPARKRVFEWCATLAEKMGFDAEIDVGQTLLFVMLD